jgi:hypothetical protein
MPKPVRALRSQKLRMLLTHRKLLQSKAIAIENDLCATLRNFGLEAGTVGTAKFKASIKELVENLPRLGRAGRTAARCPAGASRADRRPASALFGLSVMMTIRLRRAATGALRRGPLWITHTAKR